MNLRLRTFLAALTLLGVPASRGEQVEPQPVDGKIDWVYSYEQGKQEAAKSGKPLFVVFRCER